MKIRIVRFFFCLVVALCLGLPAIAPAPALAVNFNLTILVTGNGSVVAPGEGVFSYPSGTAVSLTVTPDSGAAFLGWIGDIDYMEDPYASTTNIVIYSATTITATFSGSGGGGGTTTTTHTVTSTAGANGSISPGTLSVSSGGSQTFTITPSAGYRIADVQVDGASVGAVASYTFTSVTGDHTITATFAINSFTITASASPNGSITPTGAASVNFGASQAYTITPATGYHIAGVLVDGASVGVVSTYSFTNVNTAHTISASFSINTYTVTATAAANGSISPPGASTVNYGGTQTYTITPGTGYHVVDVKVDGASVGALTNYTITNVISNRAIAATFAINTYVISPLAGDHGAIAPATPVTVNYGSSQTFTITPATGYHVADVLVDGPSVGALPSYTFSNVITSHAIAVRFAINTYVITPSAGVHGSIAPFTDTVADYGSSQTFTIAADTGYRISDVKVDGESVGAVGTYTFTSVKAAHKIDATFAIGWPFYAAMGIGVVLVFLLGYLLGKGKSA